MSRPKKKFYVVWKGTSPGVYATWDECKTVTNGFPGAKFKAFPTREEAERAFHEGPGPHWGAGRRAAAPPDPTRADGHHVSGGQRGRSRRPHRERPIKNGLCVDAAWNAVTKVMEFQGVWTHDQTLAFHEGPFADATNNIGEFLAIVHGLELLAARGLDCPVYTDSTTAMIWVNRKQVRSESMRQGKTSSRINDLVARAIDWLESHEYANEIVKWETAAWGEIPADFGRK